MLLFLLVYILEFKNINILSERTNTIGLNFTSIRVQNDEMLLSKAEII
jgi:hypothetical protein